MAHTTSGGPKGLGQFNSTPTTQADFNKLLDLIAERGNFRVGLASDRASLTGGALYDGLKFYETDTDKTYQRVGGSWIAVNKGTTASGTSVTPVVGSGFTLSANALFTRAGFLLGTIDWAKTSGTLGHADVICTLPSGARPPFESSVITSGGPSPSYIFPLGVSTGGVVSALLPVSGRTGGTLRFTMPIAY